ncbi:MAG: alpha-2-macroglobulin family protein [Ignavibacteriaceae bacterium]
MKTKMLILLCFLSVLSFLSFTTIISPPQKDISKIDIKLDSYRGNKESWSKVDSLERAGLTRSALTIVEQIYQNAKEENNSPQIIKALIYKLKYINYTEENSNKKVISQIKNSIDSLSLPAKPILQSILAEAYLQYYQQNRYRFINRTETINFDNNDFETWDLTRLLKEIIKLYHSSLVSEDSLKNIPVSSIKDILVEYKNRTYLRPTLFDLLANRALDFYMNEEASVTEPVYKFELKDPGIFSTAKKFIKLNFKSDDSLSLKYLAAKLFQELISFHINDPEKAPLIDIDLKRLNFMKSNSVIEYKDSLYLKALNEMEPEYSIIPFSSIILYNKANYYWEKGEQYNPETNSLHKWDKKKAYDICEAAIKKFPGTTGARACEALKTQILHKDLDFKVEYANLADQPFRAFIKYTNVGKVYFRIIPWDKSKEDKSEKLINKTLADYFRDQKFIKEWNTNLPDEKDFQQHSVEVPIPELKAGHYLILAGTDKNFEYDKNAVAYGYSWATNLSYNYSYSDNKIRFLVQDRKSGDPVPEADISLFQQRYDGKNSRYVTDLIQSGHTDKNGLWEIKRPERLYNLQVLLQKKNDRFRSQNIYPYYYNYNNRTVTKTFFFLDRAIYRPGQTIFFKGLMIETDGKKENHIKTNTATTVALYDVNNQKISELNLRTNDYGSFDGKFIAPSGVLTGIMTIRNESGVQSFRVEEYKRPQFEVNLNNIKGDYSLNDTVNISGYAKTYSGVNLDNATVKYRVVRRTIVPYYWWYWGHSKPDMEITNGAVKTNNNGEFNFDFQLVQDLSYSKKDNTIFNYTVYVDVVDITGETHSAQTAVSAGYISLKADIQIPETINKLDTNPYRITSTNLSGEFQPAKFNVKIYKLIEPKRIFRKRMWEKPDEFILSEEEFYKLFPHDIYNDEDKIYNWKNGKEVYNISFITTDSSMLNINNEVKHWHAGAYVLTINTKDKNGTPIEIKKYFTLFNPSSDNIPLNKANWFAELKTSAEPGETAGLLIGSAEENVKVLYELEYDGKTILSKWLTLNNEQKKIEIPVKEEYRGNLIANFISTVNNENFNKSIIINVPWTNKHLNISTETFRDKITPGEKEEWNIKISGPKGEKEAAELLASMYDASLDAFAANNWSLNIYPIYTYSRRIWSPGNSFTQINSRLYEQNWNQYISFPSMSYDHLNYFGFNFFSYGYARSPGVVYKSAVNSSKIEAPQQAEFLAMEADKDGVKQDISLSGTAEEKEKSQNAGFQNISARKNLGETAFFYPHLKTDENGEIIISFTAPEALTRWKFMAFAHTKDLKYGFLTKETVTQKELMVQSNPPRFFREGDTIYFTAKVSNLSENDLSGSATLKLYNSFTMKPVDSLFGNDSSVIKFRINKNQSTGLSWKLHIPVGVADAITYKVLAKTDNFSDGEENALPVLPNRMLVTESLPLPVKGMTTRTFVFDKLKYNKSTTLKNYKLTLEFTSNPAWYAIQALPYLMEYPYECSEQIFSRFYANSIAAHIANSNPGIKAVFESWKNIDKKALLSNLEKNQDLKNILLEETPWVLNSQSETERKKRVGLLFDISKMSSELSAAEQKLRDNQLENGGWPWFPGMPENRYITQYIIAGMGHLDKLGVTNVRSNNFTWNMIKKGVNYLDIKMDEDYQNLLEHKVDLSQKNISYIQIQYLYARTYFMDLPVPANFKTAFNYWKNQAQTYWLSNNNYMQGMIALALFRLNDTKTADAIIKSLNENAVYNNDTGMYFKLENGWYWYQAPIETQSLLIEAFDEIAHDEKSVDEMKIWLLKQKQVQDWKTTKATADACYALLLRGTDWLSENKPATIKIGNQVVDQNKLEGTNKPEAGTGYFRTSWNGEQINPVMGEVTVTNNNKVVAWGSLYWQYFEQLDKITSSETELNINKKLFLQQNTSTGPKISPVAENTRLVPGDLIKVRIEIRVDRDMEFVHLKDMRAAGFEPVSVLSQSKYQDGLWYYESTKDAATNFFINYLPKGTYVFEYELRATYKGNFSNGITSIQSMYAPEFSSHSEGIRVEIK